MTGDWLTPPTGETSQSQLNTAANAAELANSPTTPGLICYIKLGGKSTLTATVSSEDFERCSFYSWREHKTKNGTTIYAKANWKGRKGKTIYLHRLVMNSKPGEEPHHKDHDGLNCCRYNLVNVTHEHNQEQRRPWGSSGFLGVRKRKDKWIAEISFKSKMKTRRTVSLHIGVYASEIEAAQAYDRMAQELNGPTARVNFP